MTTFEIIVFNVGHGDNLLIRFPDGAYGAIDFNYVKKVNSMGEPPSLTYLKQYKREELKLHFIHISHYHGDHTKGLNPFIEWAMGNKITYLNPTSQQPIPITALWLPGKKSKNSENTFYAIFDDPSVLADSKRNGNVARDKNLTTNLYQLDELKEIHQKQGTIEYLYQGWQNPSLNTYCFSPSIPTCDDFYEKCIKNQNPPNNNIISTLIQFIHVNQKLLFGGDVEVAEWNKAIDFNQTDFPNLKSGSDFVKVSHHGSVSSSTLPIWQSILPENALTHLAISAGDKKDINNIDVKYPEKATINDINNASKLTRTITQIHCTNLSNQNPGFKYGENEYIRNWGKNINTDVNRRADGYFAGGAKHPPKDTNDDFLGFKFIYDGVNKPIKIIKLFAK